MPAYNPPSSRVVVQIASDLVDRYEAAGWTKVKSAEAEPAAEQDKPKTTRRRASKAADK